MDKFFTEFAKISSEFLKNILSSASKKYVVIGLKTQIIPFVYSNNFLAYLITVWWMYDCSEFVLIFYEGDIWVKTQ